MSSYVDRAIKFIKQFSLYTEGCITLADYNWAVYVFNNDYKRRVRLHHGMTRVAFITSDYVVKIDFNADNIAKWGGCEKEMELYAQAEMDHMEHLFAKITPFEYNGQMFYIMPLVRGIGRKWDDAWEYMTGEESNWCNDHGLEDLHNQNYGWKDNHVVLIDYGAHD